MAYNCYGDLYKREVVTRLKEIGCNVKNVHALNLLLEEMGLQKHYGNNWLTTEEGAKYTIYQCPVYDADAWHPAIIDAVYEFIKKKENAI